MEPTTPSPTPLNEAQRALVRQFTCAALTGLLANERVQERWDKDQLGRYAVEYAQICIKHLPK